jgi:hypothetical protein
MYRTQSDAQPDRGGLGHAADFDDAAGQEDAYFSELLGYSVERLGKEPDLLRAEQDQLRRQAQETAVSHYRSFIGAARCLGGLRQQLGAAAGALDALDADLPKLQAASEAFRRDAAAVAARRDATRQLAATHATLLDLLEVPALMDTCVRNGNFDEALDLRAYANKMAVVHGELPAVARLAADVAAASASMLDQLLARLQAPVQLPECLRVIGYLRRLAAFSERDLRLHFLQRREAWVASLAADLDDSSAYEFLKRLTDVYRLNLFDVVMQYRAIFAEREGPAAPPGDGDGGILYSWAERRVAAYLAAVRLHLPMVGEGGGLASVLDHAMYCGASLGRVGLDFRPALAPLFEDAALGMFRRGAGGAADTLRSLLEGHKWVALSGRAAAQRAAAAGGEDGGGGGGGGEAGGGGPPYSLMDHVPLAVYCNGLLAALNELRHCAPQSLRGAAAAALQESLRCAAAALAAAGAARPLGEAEQPVFAAACAALTGTLCPYVAACFDRIYPGGGALLDPRAVAAALADGDAAGDEL